MTVIWTITRGSVARLAMLMTHYRQDVDWTKERMALAEKTLARWGRVAVPCDDPPPMEVLEALMDDINTVKAIAAMHKLRAEGRGKDLFAAMRFLGFFAEKPGFSTSSIEWKTLPDDHVIEMEAMTAERV